MKTIKVLALVALLSLTVFATSDNPYQVWCDYHGTYFHQTGREFPAGHCYDKYEHVYQDSACKCKLTHKMSMKCQ